MAYIVVGNNRGPRGLPGPGLENSMQFKEVGQLPPLKADWIGLTKAAMYRLPNQAATDAIVDRPLGSGPALVNIYPLGSGGSRVEWREYTGQMRSWHRSVSLTSANNTDWILQTTPTRRVLHQLSMPGNTALRDTENTRHVRVPVRLPAAVGRQDITFKNFNEQYSQNYGDLTFEDVYFGKAQVGTFGQLTAQFDGPPANLGKPTASGSGSTRRYTISGASITIEPNTEYLLSYGYTNPNSASAPHLGIGGSWLGLDPSMTGRYDPPVNLTWSPNTPLDVYMTLHASTSVPANAYLGSSTETGFGSNYPLRDTWGWKHAEACGAFPVLLGQSGATLERWSSSSRYTWTKLSSTFDKVDVAYLAAGSNDVYLGRTLAQMKTDSTALAALVKLNLSTSIINANVFPRRTETAGNKTVRVGWNEHLATLPDGAVGALDRTRAVSTDAGLMRPELDSGDGTHLTAAGQDFLASAAISGAEYGGNLNRYTVSEDVGRVVKVWDYLNNREQLVYAETGLREITSLMDPKFHPISFGNFYIQRTGNSVELIISNMQRDGTSNLDAFQLPTGFRPAGTRYFTVTTISGARAEIVVTYQGMIQINSAENNPQFRESIWFSTQNAWPTTTLGTAIGTIPNQ